ncbi:MAG: hypothetical protein GY799_31460 [Desulfobulbaceae bacterium]|nr:hypothetical protein [Desulfobulbaceae bacterium]
MIKNKIIELKKPGEFSEDPLTELLRNGARLLILMQSKLNYRNFSSNMLNSKMSRGTCR